MRWAVAGLAALAVGACATTQNDGFASGQLRDASGGRHGDVFARPEGGRIRIDVRANNITPGTYGIHVHAVGRCDGPDFDSAGGHWNPTARRHGRDNPAGMHSGDLPNLIVGAERRATLSFMIDGSYSGADNSLLDVNGASIVIHTAADDYRTDPSGQSGARMICAVLR